MSEQSTMLIAEKSGGPPPVRYGVTREEIEARRAQYEAIQCTTRDGYESCRVAIAHCRDTRVAVEKRRKELKAESLDYGRRVDAVAKELTALIVSMEHPLEAKKSVVDEEKARAKREKEEAAQRAIEEKVRAEREAEEARLRVEREAEEKRLAAERAALAAERAKIEDAQKAARAEEEKRSAIHREAMAEEQAKIDAERRRIETEREALEEAKREADRIERERQNMIRAEARAKQEAEAERIAAEEARVAEAERQAAIKDRVEALRPDKEKLVAFALTLRRIELPTVSSDEAHRAVAWTATALDKIASYLDRFNAAQ
jgi:chromosome segregation ATPase